MEAFFKLASTNQTLASDFKYKGLLFSKNGQDDLALIELEKATTIDKDNQTDALGDIAEIYIKKKDYSNAIKTFNASSEVTSGLNAKEYKKKEERIINATKEIRTIKRVLISINVVF